MGASWNEDAQWARRGISLHAAESLVEPFQRRGVCEGMFEQSMLLDSTAGRKASALAASLTVQTLAAGTLLLIPLIYTEPLPLLTVTLPVFLPPPPPEVFAIHTTETMGIASGRPRVFFPATDSRSRPLADSIPDITNDGPPAEFFSEPSLFAGFPAVVSLTVIPPPPPAPVADAAPAKPIPVASDIQAAKLLRKVVPIYPRLAIAARVSGTVRLIGTIAKDGTLQQLQIVSGPALLVQAAVDAVRQWIYRPTLLGGKPVEVIAPIDVIFTLSQ